MMARMFVFIPVPDASWMTSVSDGLKASGRVSVSKPEQLHITLRFIGDVDEARIHALVSAVEAGCAGNAGFDVTLRGLGCFPNERRPRIVWAGAEPADRLTGLSDSITGSLKKNRFRFDDKPFKPHITIGRCDGDIDVSKVLAAHRGQEFLAFRCDSVKVVRSYLGPKGARHETVASIPLL